MTCLVTNLVGGLVEFKTSAVSSAYGETQALVTEPRRSMSYTVATQYMELEVLSGIQRYNLRKVYREILVFAMLLLRSLLK